MGELWPLVLYFGVVVAIVAVMIGASCVLGERHRDRATGDVYESGSLPTGSARLLLSVQFYVVAMIFVIFDLEAVFFFGWAVAARELGWAGFIGILVFTLILVAGLVYEWRQGALDWGGPRAGTSTAGERAR